MAIQSFKCSKTERLFNGEPVKAFHAFEAQAQRRLIALDAAVEVSDLRFPPGNKLHALNGDRAGQHSIRINDQFRLCFVWTDKGPANVEIVDYH
jgi:proteic killer suppression protein